MRQLLWDASGLAKRYYKEVGTDTVNAIFRVGNPLSMTMTYIGYAETAAILRRKLNGGLLPHADFQQARLVLEAEVLLNPGFELMSVTDGDILDGIALTDRHNLNSTDASLLAAYLRRRRAQPAGNPACLLIASDKRLLRAAQAEGLDTLNPQTTPAADIPMRLV